MAREPHFHICLSHFLQCIVKPQEQLVAWVLSFVAGVYQWVRMEQVEGVDAKNSKMVWNDVTEVVDVIAENMPLGLRHEVPPHLIKLLFGMRGP